MCMRDFIHSQTTKASRRSACEPAQADSPLSEALIAGPFLYPPPPAVRQALQESVTAVAAALLTILLCSGGSSTGLQGLAASLLACTLASFSWSMGSGLLLIVFSEPLNQHMDTSREEGARNAELLQGMGNSSLVVQVRAGVANGYEWAINSHHGLFRHCAPLLL